ncbi:amino acid ABC transporter permease [Rhodoligotrophos defluvii]|uniref:amino acid ABC transporter permease n=1 Tax=Rhodoligotrophos defluvii TaxID=2561934 RepID=UPI001EF157F5|nr:amino acid ABC transporter permease [Rhodoligotrophos defluvii]
MPAFLEYFFSINFVIGAGITLALTLLSMILGIIGGLVLALIKTSGIRILQAPTDLYIWLFRGTPVLLQLIFIFNALPQMGLRFSAFTSAVIALTLNEAAYMAEIIRAGIGSVDKGQRSAARVLGLRDAQIMRHIILPQAMRLIIPPTGNQFIGMLKTSALASVIAVQDLLLRAQRIASANFDYVNTLLAAGIWYLILTTLFTFGQRWLERYMDVSRRKRPNTPGSNGLETPASLTTGDARRPST